MPISMLIMVWEGRPVPSVEFGTLALRTGSLVTSSIGAELSFGVLRADWRRLDTILLVPLEGAPIAIASALSCAALSVGSDWRKGGGRCGGM